MTDDDGDAEDRLLAGHVRQLMEHFETVQIFATRRQSGAVPGTVSCFRGDGNWFARYGQVKEWVLKEEVLSARDATRRAIDAEMGDDDDEDDDPEDE